MNLTTTYLGFKLRTPLVPSASPLSEKIDNIKRMEDAGAAAIVFHSLFEEQIRRDHHDLAILPRTGHGKFRRIADAIFPSRRVQSWARRSISSTSPRRKRRSHIPIIASLNGSHLRWLAELRAANPAGRRRCARAEHLLHSERSRPRRRRYRRRLPRHSRSGESAVEHSGRGEAQPVLHQLRALGAPC